MDLLGRAIHDFHFRGKDNPVRIWINGKADDAIYPSLFFRAVSEMTSVEKEALKRCDGRILDVGAGAGCHSIELLSRGYRVTSLEYSPLSCEVMSDRGLQEVVCEDIMKFEGEKFDTILLLMNGFGLAGSESNLEGFVAHLKGLLNPGGAIIGESTDIMYMYQGRGTSAGLDLSAGYYGEVNFIIRSAHGEERFGWIYPDEFMLEEVAMKQGLSFEVIRRGESYNFLCRMGLPA